MSKRELRTNLSQALTTALVRIDGAVEKIADLTRSFERTVGVFEVQAGIGLDEIRESFATAKGAGISFSKTKDIGTDDWRVIAREKIPGKDVKTLYRWQNAGAVARVLGDDVGTALVGSLVPMYRILSALGKNATSEDRATAQALVRAVWTEALADAGTEDGAQVPPSEKDVREIAERVAPTTRSGGAETTVSEDDDDEKDDDDETRRESSETLTVVDAAAVEACAANWAPVLRQLTETHKVSDAVISSIGLAVLRFQGEYGTGAMQAVFAGKGGVYEDAA